MKISISLGGNQLVIEPETAFEEEYMKKYFEHGEGENLKATVSNEGQMCISMCERVKWGSANATKQN